MIDDTWLPTLRDGLRLQVIDGETIVLDRDNQRIHQLNEVGTFILQRCDGTRTCREVVERLVSRYDVTESRAAADTEDLLFRLRAMEILV